MKRLGTILLAALLVGTLAVTAFGEPLKIGISKIMAHPALDAVEQAVKDTLAAAGYTDIEYVLGDAQLDFGIAVSIAQNFQAQNVDLVVAIATPTAQAAAQVYDGSDVPVIFAAVTDPVASELIPSATDPTGYGNITGVSDLIPVPSHLALLKQLSSDIVKVGVVFNPGEVNSVVLTDMAEEAAPGLGLEIVTAAADSSANVPLAAQSLIGRVDAYYVTTDNTIVSAIDAILAASVEAAVPFLMADSTSLPYATLTAGFDYYVHGQAVGDVVLQVLGGAAPNTIPAVYQEDAEVKLNLDVAGLIGFDFPTSVIEQAAAILYGGIEFAK